MKKKTTKKKKKKGGNQQSVDNRQRTKAREMSKIANILDLHQVFNGHPWMI